MKLFRKQKIKNADLKKRCSEGKTGSKTALILNLFFALSVSICAQDIIRGFYNIRSESTFPGQSKIFITDFNADGMSDFIFHGSAEKFVSVHRSRRGKYAPPVNKFFFYPVTAIKKFNSIPKLGDFYFFLSRRLRLAGLFEFSPYGTLKLMYRRRFASFPSNVEVFDYDSDGLLEAAVYGENFDGITILRQNNFTFTEERIVAGKTYSYAGFSDFDYDGYTDFFAFNIIENKLEIFMNNTNGGLEYEREIQFISSPRQISIEDINGDGFSEVLYSYRNGIDIFMGDSVSSFGQTGFISTGSVPTKFLFFDFNSDGAKDLAFINSEGLLISYFKNGQYPRGVKYLSDSSLTDLTARQTEAGAILYALSSDGTFYNISNLDFSSTNEFQIPQSVSASAFIDLENDNDPDFCFIDSADSELNILVNQLGQPSILLRERLTAPYNKLLSSQFSENQKIVLSYSTGSRLFDISWVDEKNMRIQNRSYYAPGKIRQLIFNNREADGQFYISGLYSTGDSLMYFTYFLQDFDIYPDEIEYIGSSSLETELHFSNNVKLYTAKVNNDTLNLKRYEFGVRNYSLKEAVIQLRKNSNQTQIFGFHKFYLPRSLNDIISVVLGNESVLYDFYSDVRILPARQKNIIGVKTADLLDADNVVYSGKSIDILSRNVPRIYHYEFKNGKFLLKKKFFVSADVDSYFAGKFSDEWNSLVYFDSKLNRFIFQGLDD